jgi:hypothetical protein
MSYIKSIYWGPSFWKTMFSFAATYPENPDNDYIESVKYFFYSLKKLIPCANCSESYNLYINESDTDINNVNYFISKKKLVEFIFGCVIKIYRIFFIVIRNKGC